MARRRRTLCSFQCPRRVVENTHGMERSSKGLGTVLSLLELKEQFRRTNEKQRGSARRINVCIVQASL